MSRKRALSDGVCRSCTPKLLDLEVQCDNLSIKCTSLQGALIAEQKKSEHLAAKCVTLEKKLNDLSTSYTGVFKEDATEYSPSEMNISSFKQYVVNLLIAVPFLLKIKEMFLSSSHKTKLNSKKTHTSGWIGLISTKHTFLTPF